MMRERAKAEGLRIGWLPEHPAEVRALEQALRARTGAEVRFEDGTRALYATDASNYRQVPIGVVIPRSLQDVMSTVALCRERGLPILSRGCATSLAGQTCNTAVILDFSKYLTQIHALDPERRTARVQPGLILDGLNQAAAPYDLIFGPDPATHTHCTLGGMIGNDACGIHAQMAGRTSQNLEELEILTYDGARMRLKNQYSDPEISAIVREGGRQGEIFAKLRELRDRYAEAIRERFPQIPRIVSGYGLPYLLPENGFNVAGALVGSEGTCVILLEATVKLSYRYPGRALVVLGYPDVYQAGDHVSEIRKFEPIGLEGMDDLLTVYMEKKGLHSESLGLLPEGNGWLIVEFGGRDVAEAEARAQQMILALKQQPNPPSMKLFTDPAEERLIWQTRESGLGATAFVPGYPNTWPGWEDSAVPPEKVGEYLRALRALFREHGYEAAVYGHFGQGCIHCRINFELTTAEGLATYRSFVEKAADLVIRLGGSLSGEHGDGQSRGELLPRMFGSELMQAFREFKAIWDPEGKLNPGKLIDARPLTENLALGTNYRPPELSTQFAYPEDGGSFAHAALRCVGVGKCRRLEGGTMCPSFMVTREEKHTTRGRAKALFEMLQGDLLKDGWRDEGVKDALHLCLSCKGCKSDCPVNVDMATYKAEFLSHYYRGRLRPRAAYTMGLIFHWARLGALMPGLANLATQTPGLRAIAKRLAGVHPERQIPEFAPETFKAWYRKRPPRNVGRASVILWPDTFNNHFHPETAKAAVEVLEDAGFHVHVPEPFLCCGRPLFEYGFLDYAKTLLQRTLATLRPLIREGVPMVGLEPSCVAVFRDELLNLFPHDEDAKRLERQTFTLAEFLIKRAPDYPIPELRREAVVHGHCHQSALMTTSAEEAVMTRMGLAFRMLDSGCCGMAGSFGFEDDAAKHDVSVKAGERVLLPAVRAADDETLIMTDGFSCKTQIAQGTRRKALHLAQVLQLALREGSAGPRARPEERDVSRGARLSPLRIALGAMLLVGGGVWWLRKR
jgi:FAD/FMN-containing dehydrogenase/Fe-S oxidoreductase